ncbi:hypothetical protein SRIMM317S_03009 [Streptomyces rimosus subsp. rimosus]
MSVQTTETPAATGRDGAGGKGRKGGGSGEGRVL